MKIIKLMIISSLLISSVYSEAAIYRCNTKDGVVFSQIPCSTTAEEITFVKSKASISGHSGGSHVTHKLEAVENPDQPKDDKFAKITTKTSADVIVDLLGRPAASFVDEDNDEHWLYLDCSNSKYDQARCPEVLVRNNLNRQINWLPEDIMRKSVSVAKGFAKWVQPAAVKTKSFALGDTGVRGQNKSAVLKSLGEPDFKKVFNGREVWVYKQVPVAPNNTKTISIFLEFEGDVVASSSGN